MQPFKQLILAFLSLTLTTACTLSNPSSRDDKNDLASTFLIQKAEISQTRSNLDGKIAIPVSKVYSLQICVQDRELRKPIANHQFLISGNTLGVNKEIENFEQAVTSDADGCLVWEEIIPYNHLAHGHFVEMKRTLTATGIQSGRQSTSFAINPWEDIAYSLKNKKIEDLISSDNYKPALLGQLEETLASPNSLWINNLRLTINSGSYVVKDGAPAQELKIDVLTQPYLVTVKSGNRLVSETISYGEFDAEVFLISVYFVNGKEHRQQITETQKVEGRMVNGDLIISSTHTLEVRPAWGQVQLGMRVTPKQKKLGLKPFEGAFLISEFDNVKGNFFSRMSNAFQEGNGKLTLDEYLTDKTPIKAPLSQTDINSTSDTSQTQFFQKLQLVGELNLSNKFFDNQNSMLRKRIISAEFCVKNNLDNKPVAGQTFHVKKTNNTEVDLRTNDNGCFTWEDSQDFYFLAQECQRLISTRISNENLKYDQVWTINYNPWADNDKAAFIQLQKTDNASKQLLCANGKSQPVFGYYYFNKNIFNYEIDEYLFLRQKKMVRFSYNMAFRRPSLMSGTGYESIPLPAGYYLLKWAVVNNSAFTDFKSDPKSIFQVSQRIVYINIAGILNFDLPLQTENIKALGNMSRLLVELYPVRQEVSLWNNLTADSDLNFLIDKNANFDIMTYGSPLVLAENSEGASFLPEHYIQDRSLIDDLSVKFKNYQNQTREELKQIANKQGFAASENLALFNLNDPRQMLAMKSTMGLEKSDVQQWLNTGELNRSVSNKVCDYLLNVELKKPISYPQANGQTIRIKLFDTEFHISNIFAPPISDICKIKNIGDLFHVEYRYFVRGITKIQDLLPTQEDWTVSNYFSYGHTETGTFTLSGAADIKLAESADKIFNAKIGTSASHAWSRSENAGSNFNTTIPMKVDTLRFRIRAQQYEKCAIVTMKPDVYLADEGALAKRINSKLSIYEKFKYLSKGYMFCEGNYQNKPIIFEESYYIFNQKLDGTYIDNNQDHNRWLFANLRGWFDMQKFKMAFANSIPDPKGSGKEDFSTLNAQQRLKNILSIGYPVYPGQIRSTK